MLALRSEADDCSDGILIKAEIIAKVSDLGLTLGSLRGESTACFPVQATFDRGAVFGKTNVIVMRKIYTARVAAPSGGGNGGGHGNQTGIQRIVLFDAVEAIVDAVGIEHGNDQNTAAMEQIRQVSVIDMLPRPISLGIFVDKAQKQHAGEPIYPLMRAN